MRMRIESAAINAPDVRVATFQAPETQDYCVSYRASFLKTN